MKFFSLVATLATAASAVLGQYCGTKCDASKVPNEVLSAPLQLVAIVDQNNPSIKYQIGGTVIIKDDCHFTVENFYMFPGTLSAKWMGAKIGATEGINLSKDGAVSAIDPNQPQTLSFDVSDVNIFCPASLLSDVGRIQLLDSNYQLLAYADVNPSVTADGSGAKASTGTTSNTSTSNNGKSSTSDASTSKWSMAILGLTSVVALLLA